MHQQKEPEVPGVTVKIPHRKGRHNPCQHHRETSKRQRQRVRLQHQFKAVMPGGKPCAGSPCDTARTRIPNLHGQHQHRQHQHRVDRFRQPREQPFGQMHPGEPEQTKQKDGGPGNHHDGPADGFRRHGKAGWMIQRPGKPVSGDPRQCRGNAGHRQMFPAATVELT